MHGLGDASTIPLTPHRVPVDVDVVPLLLVDDQPRNLEALEVLLAPLGCNLVRAQSADEALLAVLNQEFAAIVTDIRMPGMSGIELAALIKQRQRTQHVPILFLTAHMLDERDVLRGYGTGAVDYLTKPVHPEILRSKISVFVELFRKTRALGHANEQLQREAIERERMSEALRRSNQDLELRVLERTEALQTADRRKDEFLASLAHELRNPLAPVRSAVEVLRAATTERSREQARAVIIRQIDHMTRLVDDLLDVGRITRDLLVLQVQRVELSQVVEVAIETSSPLITERRHELGVMLPTKPITLLADPARLAQVLSNLLTNAAKYTDPGGRIELIAEVDAGDVTIRVRDSGIGIEADVLPRVFDLFMQVDRGRDRSTGGLGIGLTLAQRLVIMHGGTIEARSNGVGSGSEFVVRLPISQPVGDAEPATPDGDAATAVDPLRILVVDDNEDAADMLATLLGLWGHDTRVARDGLAAIDVGNDFHPHVVLLDIGLPRLDGYQTAKRIRELAWGKTVTLAAVTGWGRDTDRQLSQDAGFDHHLVKPVSSPALRSLLETCAK